MKSFKKQFGFSTMEMLVAVTIFAIVVTVVTSTFIWIIRSKEKTETLTKVEQDARFTLDTIARTVRERFIDYNAYAGGETSDTICSTINLEDPSQNPVQIICLLGEENNSDPFVIQYKPEDNEITYGYDPIFDIITPEDIDITSFYAYISPTSSPYFLANNPQGSITIVIEATAPNYPDMSSESVHLQTTVSARDYTRAPKE
ncbi:MAG: type II secretion system protein [bacterium]